MEAGGCGNRAAFAINQNEKCNVIFRHFFFFIPLLPQPSIKKAALAKVEFAKRLRVTAVVTCNFVQIVLVCCGCFCHHNTNMIPTGSHSFCRDWLKLAISRGIDQGWTQDV